MDQDDQQDKSKEWLGNPVNSNSENATVEKIEDAYYRKHVYSYNISVLQAVRIV